MESSESSSSPSQSPIDLPSVRSAARSSISEQTRKRSKDDRNNSFSSMRNVARVLVAREREAMDLKRTLYTLSDELKAERLRADAAENKTREVLGLFKSANEAKITAEQAAARANEELRLYKMQYENAREELRRAQKLIDALEAQRIDAEEAAAKARSTARKLKEEKIIMRAREEGRKQGLEEGLAQGRVMGFEEGRVAGYEHGRSVGSERAYTSAPVTEMEYETPRARQYEPPQVSRPSTSEDSMDNVSAPNYTQPMDDNLPMPPPVTTPAPVPTPAPEPQRTRSNPQIRPISIHNVLSPSHPPVDVPPDGWIPTIDGDLRIRLPPPHEMAPPPPTSPSPPLSAVLNNVRNIDEPVMIPPPAMPEPSRRPKHRRRNSTESQSTTMSQFELLGPPSTGPAPSTLRSTVRDRPNVLSAIAEERERTSSASSPVYAMPNLSTQSFQMPTPTPGMPVPSPSVPPQNPTYQENTPRYQRSAENLARSSDDYYRTNTPRSASTRYGGTDSIYRSAAPESTPRYGRMEEPSREGTPYGRYDNAHRSPAPESVHRYPSRDNLSRAQNIYAPPHSPHTSHSSPDSSSPAIVAPTPTLRPPPTQQASENRGSMSSNEISITLVPPSRPESNISRTDGTEPHRSFLSAEDADRPLPATPTEPDPLEQPPTPTNPVIPPPVMLSGPWPPPGFVPMGPPSPGGSAVGPAGVPLPPSTYGGSTVGPAGVPLPPSVFGGTPSVRTESAIPSGFPGASEGPPPVIPLQPSSRSSQSGSSRNTKEPYTRSAIRGRDDDSESSLSSGMGSTDSLTTPPARTRKLSGRSTPAYAAAPVPPTVMYPVPPTPRSSTSNSLSSHTARAARVPLPASISGSVSGSVVGSVVGGPTTRGSVIGGTRPPSEMGRPKSPMLGGVRNLLSPIAPSMGLPTPEPVIPIPIPDPTPITQPIMIPPSPRRPTTPLADIEPTPIIPPAARAPSPVASSVSAATGVTMGTRGKKGKKKR